MSFLKLNIIESLGRCIPNSVQSATGSVVFSLSIDAIHSVEVISCQFHLLMYTHFLHINHKPEEIDGLPV